MANTKTQAEAFDDICYAAFQTHYKCVRNPGMPTPEAYWNDNKAARILWHGLIKGVVINVGEAIRQGLLPKLLETAPAPLAGLGGASLAIPGNTGPASLARKLAADMRERTAAVDPNTGPLSARGSDMPPGLAIGRATEDDA